MSEYDFFSDKCPTDLHILNAWLINRKIDVELKEHLAYKELKKAIDEGADIPAEVLETIGPHQLIASSDKGKISVIRGRASFGLFEIYPIEGEIVTEDRDIERFPDVKSCGLRIYELLTEGADVY